MRVQSSTPTDNGPADVDRWALIGRVVTSHHFTKAVQLRELLLYMAKRAIEFPTEEVSEQEIGSTVLGRKPDYNPQSDNIVRVQIRRLRQKIEEYYLTDGRDEPVVITIPKGRHVLRFEPRPDPIRIESAAPAPVRPYKWLAPLAGVLALSTLAFIVGRMSVRLGSEPAGMPNELASSPLWSRVFVKDQPTSIVIADSSLVIVENVLRKSVTLNEYINRSYRGLIESTPEPALRDALRMISNRQYTSLADAALSNELGTLGARMGARVAVRYARHMQVRDFNSGNFILIGSSHSVPWVELFDSSLNFHFERSGKDQRFGFRNRRPTSGEAGFYVSAAPLEGRQDSFATIAMVPNLARNGTVLLLTGVTMEATEAAGEFSMTNEFSQVLGKISGTGKPQKLSTFEILLKANSTAGAPHEIGVIAYRVPTS